MANRYWVGGTANWDGTAGTKWALTSGGAGGQAAPTAADDVFFDASSGAINCTLNGNRVAKSINFTGFTGTFTMGGSTSLTISGSATFVAGMTTSIPTNATIIFDGTGTLTSAGKTLGPITINGAGITVTLGDALTSSGVITVTQGTFTTSASNYSVTATQISSANSNTRTITLNGSTVTLSFAGTAINFGTQTNLTFNAGTSTINISNALGAIVVGTGVTFYDVSFTSTAITTPSIQGANTFRNLSVTGRITAGIGSLILSANQTITGTLTLSAGSNATARTFLRSDVLGTTRTLTCATVASLTDIDFRDITIAGAAAPVSGTRLGDCKGNTGITFPAAKTVYWNLAGSNNWSATAWATSLGGTPAVNNFPLAQDTAVFGSASPGTGTTTTVDASYNIGTIDMSARTSNTMTLATGSTSPTIYGNWINGTGTTVGSDNPNQITFAGRGSQTITSAGKSFPRNITINTPGGSVTLLDALVLTRNDSTVLIHSSGTFDANGYNVTLSGGANSRFTSNSGNTRTIAIGSGTWTIVGTGSNPWVISSTGLTLTGTGTISMTGALAKTFAGGNISYTNITLNQGGAGALTITGSNTFGDITNSYASTGATSILFTAGTTTTLGNWSASGAAGNLLTIGSVTAASHTLSKASGTVSADYLSISRSTATGGATWYAGANSTDGGNNSGWIFTAPPSTATGNFFLMFYP